MAYFCSFLVSSCISVLNNIQRKYFILCGISGLLTYFSYNVCLKYGDEAISALISCVILSIFGQITSKLTKVPSSVFVITGIMPIVPGSLLFQTFNNLIEHKYLTALEFALQTLLVGFSIALGLLINETLTVIINRNFPKIMG